MFLARKAATQPKNPIMNKLTDITNLRPFLQEFHLISFHEFLLSLGINIEYFGLDCYFYIKILKRLQIAYVVNDQSTDHVSKKIT